MSKVGLGLGQASALSNYLGKPAKGATGGELGKAASIRLDRIQPDPTQPRKEFEKGALESLASSIREQGVVTPISVTPNPKKKGYYVIVFGERRWRASKLAGKTTIPCFVDDSPNPAKQLIENLHRQNLTPLEIAEFLQKQVANGKKSQRAIATECGVSQAWVSQHLGLLALPKPILEAFRAGKCTDVTAATDLAKLYRGNEKMVKRWLGEQEEVSRAEVRALKASLTAPEEDAVEVEEVAPAPTGKKGASGARGAQAEGRVRLASAEEAGSGRRAAAQEWAEESTAPVEEVPEAGQSKSLVLSCAKGQGTLVMEGKVTIVLDDGQRVMVDLAEVDLLGLF